MMFECIVVSKVWRLEPLECVRVLGEQGGPVSALVVNDNLVVSGSDRTVRLWKLDELCPGRWDTHYALSSHSHAGLSAKHIRFTALRRPTDTQVSLRRIDIMCIMRI
jgi:hypothetical protein